MQTQQIEPQIRCEIPGYAPFVAPQANERAIREQFVNILPPTEQLKCKIEIYNPQEQPETDEQKIFRQLLEEQFEKAMQKGKKYQLKPDRNSDLLLNTFEITKVTAKKITYSGKNGKGETITETTDKEDFKELLKNFTLKND